MNLIPKFVFCSMLIVAAPVFAQSSAKEANALKVELEDELIRQGMARNRVEVGRLLPLEIEEGRRVIFKIYQPNRMVLAAAVEYFVAHGIEITNGVPITMLSYSRPKGENALNWYLRPKFAVRLEINR